MKTVLVLTDKKYLLFSTKTALKLKDLILRSNVSTDEIYPAKYCFFYKNIGDYLLSGDRFGEIREGYFHKKKIACVVSGENFGCGSAREHAAIAFKDAGVQLIAAKSFNKTFRSNCVNNGIYTTTNFSILKSYLATGVLDKKKFFTEFSKNEKHFLINGGFLNTKGKTKQLAKVPHNVINKNTPLTIAEKIIKKRLNIKVSPKDQFYINCDIRFTYEVFSPLISHLLKINGLDNCKVKDRKSILFFEDHFILSKNPKVKQLVRQQEKFAKKIGGLLLKYKAKGSGICHTVLVENFVLPGQVIAGTDSHTTTSGVLNALCFPVGATMMAGAIITGKIFIKLPEIVRVEVIGKPLQGVMAKDVMLYFLSQQKVKNNHLLGTILEFGGRGLKNFSLDELSVFTNMSTEAGAWTAIMEPNKVIEEFLLKKRFLTKTELNNLFVYPDKGAHYKTKITLDLSKISPMIALPSNPSKSISLTKLKKKVVINKAFIGSCTGGKLEDLRQAAKVLVGKKINKKVELVVHAASMDIYKKAKDEGLIDVFTKAGAKFFPAACGACIGQGPGRVEKGEVVISATNRNYHGRMGEGKAYLANPRVVAISAIKGFISL